MKTILSSGKRKRAIARATLKPGKGIIRFNKIIIDKIEPEMRRLKLQEPLILAGEKAKEVDINVKVIGGGATSQIEAARLAIAKALVQYSKGLEQIFLEYDRHLLVADVRRKEVCKPNISKARAKRQKSYR